VLFALLTGRFPFSAPPSEARGAEAAAGLGRLLRDMHARAFAVPDSVPLSAPALFLLQRLLEPDPRARITLPEILKVRTPGLG
jgi:hypothetical protein